VEDISKGLVNRIQSGSVPLLGLKIPDLDNIDSYTLRERIKETLTSSGNFVKNSASPYVYTGGARKQVEMDIVATKARSLEIIYLGKNVLKDKKYNLFVSFGDPDSSLSQPNTYSRDEVASIIKIADEIEKLNESQKGSN